MLCEQCCAPCDDSHENEAFFTAIGKKPPPMGNPQPKAADTRRVRKPILDLLLLGALCIVASTLAGRYDLLKPVIDFAQRHELWELDECIAVGLFLVPAENGAAWTLLHPEYTVVVPQPSPVKIPSAFGLALDAGDLTGAVNEWVVFATNEGMIQRAYDYWILGQGAEDKQPRWSILRNVLGLLD